MNERQRRDDEDLARRELDELLSGHIHVHDEYSPLDGCGNRNQISWAAAQAGQDWLGFTNHGRLGGALEHVHACRHPEKYDNPLDASQKRSPLERLKPVLAIEAFFRRDRFMDCNSTWAHHLCLHAASLAGWRTLLRLSSKSWVRREHGGGFYGKPVMDFDMLEEDHEDIIVSTACLASPIAWHIMQGDDRGLKKVVKRLRNVSKNGIIWWEIMPHDLDDQRSLNVELCNWANYFGDPIIGSSDVHIPFADWELAHQVTRLASYKQTFKRREAKKDAGEDVYTDAIDTVFLCSGSQMYDQFAKYHPDLPEGVVREAMGNTRDFSRQIHWYVIGKSTKAPKVDADSKAVVRSWVEEGWKRILGEYPAEHWSKWTKDEYKRRFESEFEVLDNKGVLPYFYIVGDAVRWAKSTNGLPALDSKGKVKRKTNGDIVYKGTKRPIRVGLGRGSAAGCLVSRLVGITAVDPIPHKLLFERFLNPDREGYPDIDLDFETELTILTIMRDGIEVELDGRECVKEYFRRMYGHDHVVDIIAYQTFAPRVVINEVGAVYDLSPHYLKSITETIGDTDRNLEKLAAGNPEKGIEPNEKLCELRDNHEEMWDVLLKMEDGILRDTRHAGGVVITPFPTNYAVPTQIAADETTTVTAWADRAEFPVMSDYGFLKYDILGVKSLAKQELAVQLIKEHYGDDFEPNDLPALHDPYDIDQRVIDAFVYGLTVGVFQFQGHQITNLLRHIKPDSITDISIANALFRPGPIGIAFEYGDRKSGKVPITFWHDALEPILGETLGLMCFQEQAMEVAKQLGGFTGGQADALRKAMSKLYRIPGDKAQEYMQQYYDIWVAGCDKNGIPERESEPIWTERFLPLGNYLFNRSHSSSYGLQAYQDMHIKIFYPEAFYASVLTIHKKQKREEQMTWLREVFREARIFDIEGQLPQINEAEAGWTIAGNKLRVGFVSVSGLGGGHAKEIIDNRPFSSFDNFIDKMPSGFGADKIASLARAGAFDDMEEREYLLSQASIRADNAIKLKLKMSCGHNKDKTIKDVIEGHEEEAIEEALELIECKTHPDAEIVEWRKLDATYEVARWLKDHPGGDPVIVTSPTPEKLDAIELETIGINLTGSNFFIQYKAFIDKRIFTAEEVERLPEQPKPKGKMHRMFCHCSVCDKARCVIGGEIVRVREAKTKAKQEVMAFVGVVHEINSYEVVFFAKMYERYQEYLEEGAAVFIECVKSDRGSLVATELVPILEVADRMGFSPKQVIPIGRGRRLRKLKKKTTTRADHGRRVKLKRKAA